MGGDDTLEERVARAVEARGLRDTALRLGINETSTLRIANALRVRTTTRELAAIRIDRLDDAEVNAIEIQAARLLRDPPPTLARIWKAARTPAEDRLPWARSIAEKARVGEAWAVSLVAREDEP